MKELLLCGLLFVSVACTQAHDANTMAEHLISESKKLYAAEDPVFRGLMDAIKNKNRVTFGYNYEALKPIIKLNEKCQHYFGLLDLKESEAMRLMIADELLSLATPGRAGLFEKMFDSDGLSTHISPYIDNLDGSVLFFATPSYKTSQNAQHVIDDLIINNAETKDFPPLSEATQICMVIDMYTGFYGGETVTKTMADNLAMTISQENRSQLLKQFDSIN